MPLKPELMGLDDDSDFFKWVVIGLVAFLIATNVKAIRGLFGLGA